MTTVALYARVSSEKQAQSNTIASQISELENKISVDGYRLLKEFKFIDNGYSGSNLNRPALENLRDKVAEGEIDRIYVHSPDRLSRKYAYQIILLEEFKKMGTEIIFLNCQTNESPESHLLLQMQGMISEYERAKIMERNRRGKIHAAKTGSVNVLSSAPYGYRYVDKHTGGGKALYEIHEDESDVIRKIFFWVGRKRLSIGEARRRLKNMKILSPKGKDYWDRSVIWLILKNPAYKGQAAFGKTKMGTMLPRIRPQKHSCEQPRLNYSVYDVEKENWIYIPVPAIIDSDLFDAVQEQLRENRKLARVRREGANYLLQGLVVCQCCRYAYYGKKVKNKRGGNIYNYTYYHCTGSDAHRFGGSRICSNKQIHTDILEIAVWEEVKFLLKDPRRITEEFQKRILELEKSPLDSTINSLEKQELKLNRGISRLIDSYAQEHISREEFEPRIKAMKQNLKTIEEQKNKINNQKDLKKELKLIITNLEDFASCVKSGLEDVEWHDKRDIIRALVRRIEINHEDVNVVFRIQELPNLPPSVAGDNLNNLQHCCGSIYPAPWK